MLLYRAQRKLFVKFSNKKKFVKVFKICAKPAKFKISFGFFKEVLLKMLLKDIFEYP